MAKQKGNVVTHGMSGKIGDLLLFRQVKGQTVISKIPEGPKKLSAKQLEHQERFRQAVLYGKVATVAPETKDLYAMLAAKEKKTPFVVAVADCLNVPEIENIDVSAYCGNQGDVIKVTASDDTMVKYVRVSIVNDDGSPVEEGEAVVDASGYVWTYTAVQNNDNLDGDKILVTVSDLPGNIVEESITKN
jgi:hypothetical protein